MSDLDDYDSILREAEVQFGDSLDHGHNAHDGHDGHDHEHADEHEHDHGESSGGSGAVSHAHAHAHSHAHTHTQGMMEDEQDDTDFVILEDENDHALGSQPAPFNAVSLRDTDAQKTHDDQLRSHPHPIGISHEAVAGSVAREKGRTWADKKERQKAQNRKAAEKSRHKKRGEQAALEIKVNDMRTENAQLKAYLSTLMAARPPAVAQDVTDTSTDIGEGGEPSPGPAPVHATTDADPATSSDQAQNALPPGTGIDYTYMKKLQAELTNVKTILLDRTLELSSAKEIAPPFDPALSSTANPSSSPSSNSAPQRSALPSSTTTVDAKVVSLRKDILAFSGTLAALQAEESSLKTLLKHLKSETESLVQQREKVEKLLRDRAGAGEADLRETTSPIPQEEGVRVQSARDEPVDVEEDGVAGSAGDERGSGRQGSAEDSGHEQDRDKHEHEHEATQRAGQDHGDDHAHVDTPVEAEADDDDAARNGNVEKALMDIRGWIDAAVQGWDQDQDQHHEGHHREGTELEEMGGGPDTAEAVHVDVDVGEGQ